MSSPSNSSISDIHGLLIVSVGKSTIVESLFDLQALKLNYARLEVLEGVHGATYFLYNFAIRSRVSAPRSSGSILYEISLKCCASYD